LDDPGVMCLRMSRSAEAERCFPCLSPTLRPWIACRRKRKVARRSSYVEELWSPMPCTSPEIRRQKHTLMPSVNFRLARRGSFSLRRGLDSILGLSQLGIILFVLS